MHLCIYIWAPIMKFRLHPSGQVWNLPLLRFRIQGLLDKVYWFQPTFASRSTTKKKTINITSILKSPEARAGPERFDLLPSLVLVCRWVSVKLSRVYAMIMFCCWAASSCKCLLCWLRLKQVKWFLMFCSLNCTCHSSIELFIIMHMLWQSVLSTSKRFHSSLQSCSLFSLFLHTNHRQHTFLSIIPNRTVYSHMYVKRNIVTNVGKKTHSTRRANSTDERI